MVRQQQLGRHVEGDLEIVEVSLPVLVTCQQGLNELRYPSLPRNYIVHKATGAIGLTTPVI